MNLWGRKMTEVPAKKFGVQYGPVTKQIFVGRINKAQNLFLEKEDCTLECVCAVVELLKKQGGSITLHDGLPDEPSYEISLKSVEKPPGVSGE